jgi:hypothetical protein
MGIRTRSIVGAGVCAAVMFVGGAGTSFAGEVKGPPANGGGSGGTTPIVDGVASSECAFSGLNALHPPFKPPLPDGSPTVQSYGMFVRAGDKALWPSPGIACNPTTAVHE